VTLRSEFGLKAIQILREQRLSCAHGAGTVLDRHMLAAAEVAGSQFIVTPGITRDLLEASVHSPIPLLPGISNASGIMEAMPGLSPLQAVPGGSQRRRCGHQGPGRPVRRSEILPDRRRRPGQHQSYMALKNVMCVGSSWMLDPEWIKNGDWARIRKSPPRLALLD
jgi:2-dehydro-3-deoxyphosphogluconate aldolase/(4S)-4-hydroxy-2-oxoglutarate aldolase